MYYCHYYRCGVHYLYLYHISYTSKIDWVCWFCGGSRRKSRASAVSGKPAASWGTGVTMTQEKVPDVYSYYNIHTC